MTVYNSVISRRDNLDTRLWLYALARRALAIQKEAGGDLPAARVLNRLHADGIDCIQSDVDAALAAGDPTGKETGISAAEVATLVGVETPVLEGWLANPTAQEDMPVLKEVYRSTAGKVVSYDYFDALLLKRWKAARTQGAK